MPGKRNRMPESAWLIAGLLTVFCQTPFAQTGALAGEQVMDKVAPSVVLVLVEQSGTQSKELGSGVIVDSKGIILTARHVVKNAAAVQVRLNNGETYDNVQLISTDERRDIAALRISAAGLHALPTAQADEKSVGETVYVVSNPLGMSWTISNGVLSALRLADQVPGAGHGYRLLQFTAPASAGSSGGALVDDQGRLLGIVVGSYPGQSLNFAVPVESVMGLAAVAVGTNFGSGHALTLPSESNQGAEPSATPEAVHNTNTRKLVGNVRTLCVTSKTVFFKPDLLINELNKRSELHDLGLAVAADCRLADVDMVVDRPLFTYDWTFVAKDRKTSLVIATGKVTSVDDIHAASGLAKQFLKQMKAVHDAGQSKDEEKHKD
jgi:trypsin-like peptidase